MDSDVEVGVIDDGQSTTPMIIVLGGTSRPLDCSLGGAESVERRMLCPSGCNPLTHNSVACADQVCATIVSIIARVSFFARLLRASSPRVIIRSVSTQHALS